MKLYEIEQQQELILNEMIEIANDSDSDEKEKAINLLDCQAKINALTLQKEDKIFNIAKYVKNLRVELAGFKEEKKRVSNMQKITESKIKSLENFLLFFVKSGEKFKNAQMQVSWRKSKMLQIDLSFIVPEKYKKWVVSIDKTQITKDIKNDLFCDPKCKLIEKNNLQIK